jgi:hypothetical protein
MTFGKRLSENDSQHYEPQHNDIWQKYTQDNDSQHYEPQHNDIWQKDTQHHKNNVTRIMITFSSHAGCYYAVCHLG